MGAMPEFGIGQAGHLCRSLGSSGLQAFPEKVSCKEMLFVVLNVFKNNK